MKITKITLAALIAATTLFTSCKKDKDEDPEPEITTTTDGALKLTDIVPGDFDRSKTSDVITAYSSKFKRDGKSTVSFSGQTTRLKQAKEIGGNLANGSVTSSDIQTKFEGVDGKSSGFTDATLNGTTKIVRSKISASIGLFSKTNSTGQGKTNVEVIDAFITGHDAVRGAWSNAAASGKAGNFKDGDKTRYVDAKGRELDQLFTKSLNGALAYDQAVNHYFNRLDDENGDKGTEGSTDYRKANDAGTTKNASSSYTVMEHHWDESFGYIYGNIANQNLIYKYIDNVDGLTKFKGIEKEIISAYANGRLAIVNKDYTKRDQEVKTIREKLALVIAVRAVNYLIASANELKSYGPNAAGRTAMFHDLSEGYGFVNALRYLVKADGKTRYFSDATVDAFLAKLDKDNGFWSVSRSDLVDIADDIAEVNVGGVSWEVSDVKALAPLNNELSDR